VRSSDWILICYFAYAAVLAQFRIAGAWREWVVFAAVVAALRIAARARLEFRDWIPLAATLTAYREMDWFTPAVQDHHLEHSWIVWDRLILDGYRLRAAIESAGALVPGYLELCYLLVYAVAAVSLAALLLNGKREQVDRFWLAYLAGTLSAYALFPFFPSEPPRTVFPTADLPNIVTFFRRANLFIVGGYGIHSSVFPSAHVSSAFSASWALLAIVPEKRWIGLGMTAYAISVAVATVYGRYHYGVDALAGFGISLLAIPAILLWRKGSQ
jgi:membrane-associated phospholipid phosphatase